MTIQRIKRMLLINMPCTACNLRCEYCYITIQRLWKNKADKIDHTPEEIANALSIERTGGVCFINFCGGGETLIPTESIHIIRALLKEGHYIEVVTNGTISNRFDEIAAFPNELRKRLTFKFSFHYKELKKRNLINEYFNNVFKMHNAGCSFTVEMTPYDEIDTQKEEILSVCNEYLGAPCQCTIARDDTQKGIPVLSKKSLDEYCNYWSDFNSEMLKFKKRIFGIKRNEFCYAGLYSLQIRLSNGSYSKCYSSPIVGNIYDNLDKPLRFEPIGKCPVDHCYNGHAHLSLGLVPSLKTTTYTTVRNIHLKDGTDSLSDTFKRVFSQKITNNSKLLSIDEERAIYRKEGNALRKRIIKDKIRTTAKKIGLGRILKRIRMVTRK